MVSITSFPATADEPPAQPALPYSPAYTRYAMGMLFVIYVTNFLDRQVVNILAEPIKQDLHLADWQLGLMTGLGFMFLYTIAAIPIARLAETKNRATIISISVAVWSGFSALCGATHNFVQLYLMRMGVGLGEAGFTAPAFSLIGDYVARHKRSSAIAFLFSGSAVGSLVGMAFGGLVADAHGWRAAFLVSGLPGLFLGVLAIFTLKDPRTRKMSAGAPAPVVVKASMGETLRYIGRKPTFWWLLIALTLKSFVGMGAMPFMASFFLRNHTEALAGLAAGIGASLHYDLKSIGLFGVVYGVLIGVCSITGNLLGGRLLDRWGARDARFYVWAPAIACLVALPLYIPAMFSSSVVTSLVMLGGATVIGAVTGGPVYGLALSIAPPHMRATNSAVMLAIINLLAMGFGPVCVGVLSDVFSGPMGLGSAEGVRWAITSLHVLDVVACGAFVMAAKSIRDDLED